MPTLHLPALPTFSPVSPFLAEHTTPYAPLPMALMGWYLASISKVVRHTVYAALPGTLHSFCGSDTSGGDGGAAAAVGTHPAEVARRLNW